MHTQYGLRLLSVVSSIQWGSWNMTHKLRRDYRKPWSHLVILVFLSPFGDFVPPQTSTDWYPRVKPLRSKMQALPSGQCKSPFTIPYHSFLFPHWPIVQWPCFPTELCNGLIFWSSQHSASPVNHISWHWRDSPGLHHSLMWPLDQNFQAPSLPTDMLDSTYQTFLGQSLQQSLLMLWERLCLREKSCL